MLSTWLDPAVDPPGEADVEGLVGEILDHGWSSPETAFRLGARVWRNDRAVARALTAAERRETSAIDVAIADPAFAAAMARPLATAILRACPVTAPEIEFVLTRWRRHLLLNEHASANDTAIVNLALQCWLNEFVFSEAADETRALERARPELKACYRRIERAIANPAFADVVRAHLQDSDIETQLSAEIPAIGAITDAVSRSVQNQYEANPYPRWAACQREQPRRFGEFLSAISQAYGVTLTQAGPSPDILIAGCGTGLQAIQCASQFSTAKVVGLDLSRPSLAYAARMGQRFSIKNLELVVGDLLDLPGAAGWDDRFHYIECLGVLHHLARPGAGLVALARCLKPGGLIYLGLYSAEARKSVVAARELIAREKLSADAAGIRAFRRLVFDALKRPGPKADRLRPLIRFIDFYSTSMCRDLVFHVQEHQFKSVGVVELIRAAGLQFLGIGIDDPELAGLYAHEHPGDPKVADPAHIDKFERKYPAAFASQYLCLAMKPVG